MSVEISSPRASHREWVGLAVLALPCLLYSMDLTVLNLAVPQLSAHLRPTSSQLLWIVDIYGFLLAGLLLTMGTLGDRIGRRRLLLIGAAAFGIASTWAAFSNSAQSLIAARAALGVAGATLAPSTLALIRNMFTHPQQRAWAIGVWAMSFSVGGAIGPLLAGMLLEHYWWGSVFLLAVPVMLVLLMVGPKFLPESRDTSAVQLDAMSVVSSLAAVLLTIYGVKRLAHDGAGWQPAMSLLAGLALGVAFLHRQHQLANPLLDLKLFRIPGFSLAVLTNALGIFVAFASSFLIAQYLQLVVGFRPFEAGLWMTPKALGFILGCMAAPALVRRVSVATAIAGGLVLAAIGFLVLSRVETDSGAILIVVASVTFALGVAPALTLTTSVIVELVHPERAGVAAAISETGSELGGALGIAILGSIAAARYREIMHETLSAAIPPELMQTARGTIGGAFQAAHQLPDEVAVALMDSAREAFTRGMQLTSVLSALVLLLLAAAVVLPRSARSAVP